MIGCNLQTLFSFLNLRSVLVYTPSEHFHGIFPSLIKGEHLFSPPPPRWTSMGNFQARCECYCRPWIITNVVPNCAIPINLFKKKEKQRKKEGEWKRHTIIKIWGQECVVKRGWMSFQGRSKVLWQPVLSLPKRFVREVRKSHKGFRTRLRALDWSWDFSIYKEWGWVIRENHHNASWSIPNTSLSGFKPLAWIMLEWNPSQSINTPINDPN